MKVGNKVELICDADFTPYTVVRAGERGTIVYNDNGTMDVELEQRHPGLDEYANRIWITPGDGIAIRKVRGQLPQGAWCRMGMAFIIGLTLSSIMEVSLAHTLKIPSTITTWLHIIADEIDEEGGP